MNKKKIILGLLIFTTVALFITSQEHFDGPQNQKNAHIKIGTTNTTESQIIGNILKELIQHETKNKVKLIINLGSSSVLQKAMVRGDINISATRYTGTELAATLHQPAIHNADKAEQTVRRYFKSHFRQTWFNSYGFSDTYVILTNEGLAKNYNLTKISDLQAQQRRLKMAVDSSWYEKEGDGYTGKIGNCRFIAWSLYVQAALTINDRNALTMAISEKL
ncbi:glycine betaine ABC transporter substrate-binding protein [Leuconostoc falkenbergense]|uniref:glycine betaine ABC transporter substrate-binding protein n=1 Tax=Leuconostoc falkenbergense TaxID=2766470 RepID=UPI0024A83DC0|nr:glycine betaine ABC transporter substrate-binding protein [Leuconostoc falkenbergense]MDI6554017.1 glycine betaine ABC transporter substrate-binding protein [Leuconostoc falkenbergense]